MADSTSRRKFPDMTEALTGRFDEQHAVLVGALLTRLEHTGRGASDRCRARGRMIPFVRQLELMETIPESGWSLRQVFVAETGGDMTRFGSPEQLLAWSVSLRRPRVGRQANARGLAAEHKWLCSMLLETANSASRTTHLPGENVGRSPASAPRRGRGAATVPHLDAG